MIYSSKRRIPHIHFLNLRFVHGNFLGAGARSKRESSMDKEWIKSGMAEDILYSFMLIPNGIALLMKRLLAFFGINLWLPADVNQNLSLYKATVRNNGFVLSTLNSAGIIASTACIFVAILTFSAPLLYLCKELVQHSI